MEATYLKSRCFRRRHGSSALELPGIVPLSLLGVIRWDSFYIDSAQRQDKALRTYQELTLPSTTVQALLGQVPKY